MLLPALLLFLPLVAAAVVLMATRRHANASALVSVGSSVLAFLLALVFLGKDDGEATLLSWARVGDLDLRIGFLTDQLSRGMMFVVTSVGMLVHIYSLGYMKDDPGKARYFAGLSLFMFSMTGIVLAQNFVMMFIFWELVGLSSYILIGHWFSKPSAADAAKKAFLTNRIGDFGFMAGILLLWALTGAVGFAAIESGLGAATAAHPGFVTAAALCIFAGAVGKSAQFPLHVWLPDAMEGPTPVSALIHAATMVAAGVYMLVRVEFLVASSHTAATIIAVVGGITALLAALMATQQNDIKRVLAYSTLSQLGYMVMAVGLLAGAAAMFHLFTHAFFKALLFLGAGAVIYACHHEQDIWKMGGLRKKMPVTFWTFLAATAALVAVPGTSGFFSKEAVLEAGHHHSPALFWMAAAVAFLTAFYMTRLVVITFMGAPRSTNADHAAEVPRVMWIPLVALAVPSLIAGYGFFSGLAQATRPEPHFELGTVFWVSLITLLAGGAIAALLYIGRDRDPLSVSLLAHRFYFDEFYDALVRYCQGTLATITKAIDDYLIGGLLVRGGTAAVAGVGEALRRLQTGNLQGYALLFGFGVVVVVYLTVFAG